MTNRTDNMMLQIAIQQSTASVETLHRKEKVSQANTCIFVCSPVSIMKKQHPDHIRKIIALCTAIALPVLSVLSPVEKITGQPAVCVQTAQAKSNNQTKQVVTIINKKRKANGAKAVKSDAKLQKAAQKRAKELVKKFDHTRPNGKNCFTVLKEYKISYGTCGENIAMGQPNAKRVMKDWMNSSGHRANILNKSFKRVGVGLYKKSGRCYWVQIFAG